MQEQDIPLQFLIGPEVGQLFDPHQEPGLGEELAELVLGMVLRQMVLAFLLGHLVVSIVLRVQHIQTIKAATLVKDLLLALLLRLEPVPLDAVDRLPEKGGQVLELKDAEEIPDQIFAVGRGLGARVGVAEERVGQVLDAVIIGILLAQLVAIGKELPLYGLRTAPNISSKQEQLSLQRLLSAQRSAQLALAAFVHPPHRNIKLT